MDAFLISAFTIALGEIGDKTQLLALLLAARFKRPIPIVLGIFVATLCNHLLASLAGHWAASLLPPDVLRWSLGLSFLVIAVWTLKADKMEDDAINYNQYGVFAMSAVAFFLAEFGDKTQIATMVLAAKYDNLWLVLAGSTFGMMVADVPAVLLGKSASPHFPFQWVRRGAAVVFAILGIAVLCHVGDNFF